MPPDSMGAILTWTLQGCSPSLTAAVPSLFPIEAGLFKGRNLDPSRIIAGLFKAIRQIKKAARTTL
jgi:hypothetical protein